MRALQGSQLLAVRGQELLANLPIGNIHLEVAYQQLDYLFVQRGKIRVPNVGGRVERDLRVEHARKYGVDFRKVGRTGRRQHTGQRESGAPARAARGARVRGGSCGGRRRGARAGEEVRVGLLQTRDGGRKGSGSGRGGRRRCGAAATRGRGRREMQRRGRDCGVGAR